jgi:hypothetical protein
MTVDEQIAAQHARLQQARSEKLAAMESIQHTEKVIAECLAIITGLEFAKKQMQPANAPTNPES